MNDSQHIAKHAIISKQLFFKHLMIRILVVANVFILHLDYGLVRKLDQKLTEVANTEMQSRPSLSDFPPIINEAVMSLVADDMVSYRYDTAWESWEYLQHDTRKFVIENLARDVEKIDIVKSRIDALDHVFRLSKKWRDLFVERYNSLDYLDRVDPFDHTIISRYNLLMIEKWQVEKEMQYSAYISKHGLVNRYCIFLKDESAIQKNFCEYLMNIYLKDEKSTFAYHMLLTYFVNWPSNEPVTYDQKIATELIEAVLEDAIQCLAKSNLQESASNLEKYLIKLKTAKGEF